MSPSHSRQSAPARSEDDIVSVFLRIPPDDPACLVRASLVCKDWRRILTGAEFCHLYREFHRTPPVLGFVISCWPRHSLYASHFIPTTAVRLSAGLDFYPHDWKAVDSRHGRILVELGDDDDLLSLSPTGYIVWDPITNGRWGVPIPRIDLQSWTAAFLCAKEHCDHLGCHGPPFLVAMVGSSSGTTYACLYSSDSGVWSDIITLEHWDLIASNDRSILVGNTLYFPYVQTYSVLQHNLGEQKLSSIDPPQVDWDDSLVFISVEDDVLLFAGLDPPGTRLSLWSTQAGAPAWMKRTVIDLEKLLPPRALEPEPHAYEDGYKRFVSAFAEGAVFLSTAAGLFRVELNSGRTKKVAELELTHC